MFSDDLVLVMMEIPVVKYLKHNQIYIHQISFKSFGVLIKCVYD